MKKYYFAAAVLFFWTQAFAVSFNEYINNIEYKGVTDKLTDVEKREFSKIYFDNDLPLYEDRLIKLYLVASEINTESEFNSYLKQFEALVSKARQIEGLNNLNRYNKAERLLHFLHDESFSKELTGPAAGYNIGIKETLDTKVYNCYKSALIYNALLEYFDYQTYLVLVTEHIYSVVIIDGKEISVETTNRYGFDSYNNGGADFKRKFDKPNISLQRKNYRSKNPIDNVTAAGIIYNNLLLLYAGREKYPGYPVPVDMERSALLGMLGLFITGENEAISNNVQYPFYRITEAKVKGDPLLLDEQYSKMYNIISHPNIAAYNKQYRRNLSILVMDSLPLYREKRYGKDNSLSVNELIKSYKNSLFQIEKYSLRDEITDSAWNNTIIQFMQSLKSKSDTTTYEGIINYTNAAYALINDETLKQSNYYTKYKEMLSQYPTTELNNYIAGLINNNKHRQAFREAETGISYLKEINFYHPQTMRTLERNRNTIQQYLQNN